MHILYLTNSIREEDYNLWAAHTKELPNPSNQNFHNRLINCLMRAGKVDVLSLISHYSGEKEIFVDDDDYHHINYRGRKSDLFGRRVIEASRIGASLVRRDTIILFDPLSVKLGKIAYRIKKEKHCKVIAILTDNPKNLSKASPFYSRYVFSHVRKADGVLSLTHGLLKAYGVEKKPNFIFEGIIEESLVGKCPLPKQSFIYFGGSLLPRYGIDDLLNAYMATAPKYFLIIAGKIIDKDVVEKYSRISNGHIRFLGQVSKSLNFTLESNAVLLVNPRPYDKKLDEESIPSKMLEYVSTTTPIVSYNNDRLKLLFPNDISWIGKNENLTQWFKSHLDNERKFINLVPNGAKEKAISRYGYEVLSKKIQFFLDTINSFSS